MTAPGGPVADGRLWRRLRDTGPADSGRVNSGPKGTKLGGSKLGDLRLVPLALSVWAATLAVPVSPRPVVIGVVIALVLGAVGLALAGAARGSRRDRSKPGRGRARAVILVLVGAASAGLVTLAHVAASRAGPVPALAEEAATAAVEMRVSTDPVRHRSSPRRPPYVVFKAQLVSVRVHHRDVTVRTPVVVVGPVRWLRVEPGERIRTRGRFAATDPGEREAAVFSARAPPEILAPPGPVQRAASVLRADLRRAAAHLPTAERGLVPALVDGDVSGIPPELTTAFQTTGLTHLVAVSGSNLSILLAFVIGGLRWAGLRSWAIPLAGAACVAGFVVVARPEPSVLRAAAMGLVGLAGIVAGARRHGLPSLAIAVILLLLVDPWLGRSYGFALSVLATGGILVLAPPYTRALMRLLPRRIPERIARVGAAAMAVPLAAQLACTPVIVLLSGKVSIVAVLANLAAGVVVAPATVLGVAALILGPVSIALAAVPATLAGLAAWWIVEVATRAAAVPGSDLAWSTSAGGVVALLLLCGVVAVVMPRVLGHRLPALALAILLVGWLVHPVGPPGVPTWWSGWPPPGWVLVACDVGQGDALVLNAGQHAAVVVDTGPEPAAVDGCLRRLGVREVPYVLLTHFHADHVGGLAGVLRGRSVTEIGIGPLDSPPAEARQARAIAAESGVPLRRVRVGERRHAGQVSWTVLGPAEADGTKPIALSAPGDEVTTGGSEESDANDASVVLMAQVRGVRILLPGDAEPPEQRDLVRSGADLAADVLKVPHHGSRYQDPSFLESVHERVAVISVGADNDYGHPAPTTVDELREDAAAVARTDRDGSVAVVGHDGQVTGLVRRQSRSSTPERAAVAAVGS